MSKIAALTANVKKLYAFISAPVLSFIGRDTKISNYAWFGWGLLVFMVPFQLHYAHILNLFYHIGAGFGDAGLFAAVSWRNDLRLTTPIAYDAGNVSFFALHFTPLLWVLSQVSYFIPTYKPEYYGIYTAVSYAMLSVAMFVVMRALLTVRNHVQMALIAAACIALAFSTAIMRGLWYVHIEYAIVTSIFFFLYAYLRGHYKFAAFFLVLTIMQREDGGFHLVSIMGLIAAVKWWHTRSFKAIKREAIYTILAFSGSLLAWGITFLVREYDGGRSQSNWELMYAGKPAFSHVTWTLFYERLENLFVNRTYIWLPLWFSLVWAVSARSLYYAIGVVATLPWLLLNLISVQKMTGEFQAYYAFPFLIGIAWPFFGVMLEHGRNPAKQHVRQAMMMYATMVFVCLFVWDTGSNSIKLSAARIFGTFSLQEGARNRDLVQQFVMRFDGGAGDLGRVRSDAGMTSLISRVYKGNPVPYWNRREEIVDTILFMTGNPGRLGKDEIEGAKRSKLSNTFCMPGTTVCLITNRNKEQLGTLGSLLETVTTDPVVFQDTKDSKGNVEAKAKKPGSLDGIDFDALLGKKPKKPAGKGGAQPCGPGQQPGKPAPAGQKPPVQKAPSGQPTGSLKDINFNKLLKGN